MSSTPVDLPIACTKRTGAVVGIAVAVLVTVPMLGAATAATKAATIKIGYIDNEGLKHRSSTRDFADLTPQRRHIAPIIPTSA